MDVYNRLPAGAPAPVAPHLANDNALANADQEENVTATEQPSLQPGCIIRERWSIVRQIGGGAFGETYEAEYLTAEQRAQLQAMASDPESSSLVHNINNLPGQLRRSNRPNVCIKVEKSDRRQALRTEIVALKRAQECDSVVRYIASGHDAAYTINFLVMECLGENLAEVRKKYDRAAFDLNAALQFGLSCLNAIEGVHRCGIVHRDIKPSNFTVAKHIGAQCVDPFRCFLIDFGLARKFRGNDGAVREPRSNAGFRGTARYASINSHLHRELYCVDDLWSLFFMIVEWIAGRLPWRGMRDKDEILAEKQRYVGPLLVRYLPREFNTFQEHLMALDAMPAEEAEPDYALLRELLVRCIERKNCTLRLPLPFASDEYNERAMAQQRARGQSDAASATASASGASPAGQQLQQQQQQQDAQLSDARERPAPRATASASPGQPQNPFDLLNGGNNNDAPKQQPQQTPAERAPVPASVPSATVQLPPLETTKASAPPAATAAGVPKEDSGAERPVVDGGAAGRARAENSGSGGGLMLRASGSSVLGGLSASGIVVNPAEQSRGSDNSGEEEADANERQHRASKMSVIGANGSGAFSPPHPSSATTKPQQQLQQPSAVEAKPAASSTPSTAGLPASSAESVPKEVAPATAAQQQSPATPLRAVVPPAAAAANEGDPEATRVTPIIKAAPPPAGSPVDPKQDAGAIGEDTPKNESKQQQKGDQNTEKVEAGCCSGRDGSCVIQ